MIYFYSTLHMLSCIYSLVIAIKPKTKCEIYASAMLFYILQEENYLDKSCEAYYCA